MESERYCNDDKIICPYCDNKRRVDAEFDYDDSDSTQYECGNCGKTYFCSLSVSYAWTTTQDCELNNEKHDWKTESETDKNIGKINKNTGSIYSECSKCGKTKYRNA